MWNDTVNVLGSKLVEHPSYIYIYIYTLSQNDRDKFKRLCLLHGLPEFCNILHSWTMKVQKCACQISSDLLIPRARYGDLNGRVKNRSFQAAIVARISSCSLYAGDIGLMHSREPVRRVWRNVTAATSQRIVYLGHLKMVFSEDDRVLIKVLRQDKGYNVWTLLSEFPHKNWSRPALYRLIAQIDATE